MMLVDCTRIDTGSDGLMGCPHCQTAEEYREVMRTAYSCGWGQLMHSVTRQERVTINGPWAQEAAAILRKLGMRSDRIEVVDE